LCEIFDNVITIDIKAHSNFELLRQQFPGYQYFITDSTSNQTVDFLSSLGIRFDFIFIDGDHSYEVVKSDWSKYKRFLAKDGLVAFHDIVFSDDNRRHRIEVDLLWSELRKEYAETYEFVSATRDDRYPNDNDFHRILKDVPYNVWGGIGVLRIDPVAVFAHNYLENNWHYVVKDQLQGLVSSGLYKRADKIHYGVYAKSTTDYDVFRHMVSEFDEDRKIEVFEYQNNDFEFTTLAYLQSYCCANTNAKVLYYHTKGTSRNFDFRIESWRKCMEYFTVERWRESLSLLKNSDVCGPLYEEQYRITFDDSSEDLVLNNYFSGNFWWANADYVRNLPNITRLMAEGGNRTTCELWIGMSPHTWNSPYRMIGALYYETYFDPESYRID
jgi:hypothetical protein